MSDFGLPPPDARPGILLVEADYVPGSLQCAPVRLIGQVVRQFGEDTLWIDGVDIASPILVPLKHLASVQFVGTFESFCADHDREIAELADNCNLGQVSPTVVARAVMSLDDGGDTQSSPQEALDSALLFGEFIREMDAMDRRLFHRAVSFAIR